MLKLIQEVLRAQLSVLLGSTEPSSSHSDNSVSQVHGCTVVGVEAGPLETEPLLQARDVSSGKHRACLGSPRLGALNTFRHWTLPHIAELG